MRIHADPCRNVVYMLTRKEIVRKAVHFEDAPRMPKFFFNGTKTRIS